MADAGAAPPEVRQLLDEARQQAGLGSASRRIGLLRKASELVSREQDRFLWAVLQVMLADARRSEPEGDRTADQQATIDNLEQVISITACRKELAGLWAMAATVLADAYARRASGAQPDDTDTDTDTERAIELYRMALSVGPPEIPEEVHARGHLDLGRLYVDRPEGDPSENLRLGIACYKAALKRLEPKNSPEQWSEAQHNLGMAFVKLSDIDIERRSQLQEQAIVCFDSALSISSTGLDQSARACTQHELGIVYQERVKADPADSRDRSIDCFKAALEVYRSRDSVPDQAIELVSLGEAYRERIRGDLSENLKCALNYLREAQHVYDRIPDPVGRAKALNGLGLTYSEAFVGDGEESNFRAAVSSFTDALAVFQREGLQAEAGVVLHNLGITFAAMPGDLGGIPAGPGSADNIERAIVSFRDALNTRTRSSAPLQWAATHVGLGGAYLTRSKGERLDNVEQAIAHYHRALEVFSPATAPVQWAIVQQNLGSAYANRVSGTREENLEQAIACYELAATVFTPTSMPTAHATVRANLAVALSERAHSDPAADRGRAITELKAALKVIRPDTLPSVYAMLQQNLGSIYLESALDEKRKRTRLLNRAVSCFEAALEKIDKEATPLAWAMNRANLGTAQSQYLGTARREHLQQAIRSLEAALKVLRPESFPRHCRQSAAQLGDLYAEDNRWAEAVQAYEMALDAAEARYTASLLREAKQAELAETSDLHLNAAYAYAQSGREDAALTCLERGRARGLGEMLARDRAELAHIPEGLRGAYQAAAGKVRQAEAREWSGNLPLTAASDAAGPGPREGIRRAAEAALRQEMSAAQTDLREVIDQVRRSNEAFLARPDTNQIADAVEPNTPVAYLATTKFGSLVLLLRRSAATGPGPARKIAVEVLVGRPAAQNLAEALSLFALPELDAILIKREAGTVVGGYLPGLVEEPECLDAALDELLPILGERLVGPLSARLHQVGAEGVVLIPCGRLGLLPLHAASFRHNGEITRLIEEFDVTYAPSARVLAAARQTKVAREKKTTTRSDQPIGSRTTLAGVGNPLLDLRFAEAELAEVARHFGKNSTRVLYGEAATKDSLIEAAHEKTHVHLACHGSFNVDNPLASSLQLAEGELTLQDLLAERPFENARLVVASACQTAVTDFTRLPDEAIGLPAGFLHAGTLGAIGTLWSVHDSSAALLITRFYDLLLPTNSIDEAGEAMTVSHALRLAQQWLSQATSAELDAYVTAHPALAKRLRGVDSGATGRPFAAPSHWAPFIFVGT